MAYCRSYYKYTRRWLADDNTLKLRFNKDGKTAYATYVITEKSGEKYLILHFAIRWYVTQKIVL